MGSRAERAKLSATKLASWISVGCDVNASVYVKIGQRGEQAGGRQADSGRLEQGNTREPAFGHTKYPQVAPVHKPAPGHGAYNHASRGDPQISGDENLTPVNFLYSLRDDQQQAFRAIA